MSPTFSTWVSRSLISIATVTTVLFATGRSYPLSHAAILSLGTNAYRQLCQLNWGIGDTWGGPSDSLDGNLGIHPDPAGDHSGLPDLAQGSGSATSVPEPSGTSGLIVLAAIWLGILGLQRWMARQPTSKTVSGPK